MRKEKSKSEGSLYYFNTRRVAVNLKEKTKQQQKVGRLLVQQQQQQLWRRPLWLPLRFWVSAKSQLCSLYYFSSFSLLVMINIISSFIYRHYKRSAGGGGWFEAKEKVVLVVVVVIAATTKACASVASFKYNLNNDVGTLMAVRAAWVLRVWAEQQPKNLSSSSPGWRQDSTTAAAVYSHQSILFTFPFLFFL